MFHKLLGPCAALTMSLSQAVFAAEVTIDPGQFKGDYNAGTGWIRGGAIQSFTYTNGTTQTISVGGSYPNEISFHINASGAISSDSSRITIIGNTINFHTVTVDIDPGLYDGRYNILGYRSGPASLQFVPAGTGADDFGSRYTVSNGTWPWSTWFDVDVNGNIVTDSSRILASANTITFLTVPVVIDPGAYTGRHNTGGKYRSGLQTIHLMPEGTGQADYGSRWAIGNGSWPWGIYYDLDVNGNVITDSSRVTVQGNTITFHTVPIVIDPGMYEGRYSTPAGYLQGGPHTIYVLPGGTGSMDFGSRWALGNGTWPFAIYFDIDLSGNVVSDSTRLDISGNYMTLQAVPIDIDPGAYTGLYIVDGVNLSGPHRRYLMQAGSGTMDFGARWQMYVAGLPKSPFDIDNPCAIIPDETITVGTGTQAIDFTITCGDVIVDTDGDGVADSSDNCPAIANADQLDQDNDGAGNICDNDLDGDGLENGLDNCPDLANSDQSDLDGDGLGDDCDDDADGDNVSDMVDNCPTTANTDQANGDGDSQGDACDDDDDNDGYDDMSDNCPNTINTSQLDTDGDGEGDACDGDVDGDSVGNDADACPETPAGLPITEDGCSAQQWVDGLCNADNFPNHGRYVSCVSHVANDLVDLGLLTNKEKSRFITQAARK